MVKSEDDGECSFSILCTSTAFKCLLPENIYYSVRKSKNSKLSCSHCIQIRKLKVTSNPNSLVHIQENGTHMSTQRLCTDVLSSSLVMVKKGSSPSVHQGMNRRTKYSLPSMGCYLSRKRTEVLTRAARGWTLTALS